MDPRGTFDVVIVGWLTFLVWFGTVSGWEWSGHSGSVDVRLGGILAGSSGWILLLEGLLGLATA